jgi:hypothetical protein
MGIKLANMSILDHENSEGMNITFYNAKSNCLPPINRQNSWKSDDFDIFYLLTLINKSLILLDSLIKLDNY